MNVPGSISSASDLQIGHVAIAIPPCGVLAIMRWIGSKYDAPAGRLQAPWVRQSQIDVSDTALKTRKDAEPEQWERALKKAIERAGAEERPKILDLDF
jgi:hypothetical protein